jgi:hypothetical protein
MPEVIVKSKVELKPPRDLKIYRLRSVKSDREAIRTIGGRFGLRAELEHGSFTEDASTIAYTEAPWTMKLFRPSGGWKYRNDRLWQVDDGQANLRLEDAEAFRLALELLVKFKLVSEKEVHPLRVARLRVAHSERGKLENNERVIDVGVCYERVVDGLPVEGPGGKTVVYLNHERELTGVDHLWHEIEKVYEPVKALRPVEYAIGEVRRRYPEKGPGRVEVTGIRLGYFEMNWNHVQEYLQPAYVVFVRLVSQDERIQVPSVLVFPAAENSVGVIEPEPRPQIRQTARVKQ